MGMNAIESEIFDSIQRLDEPVHSRKIAEYTGFDISDCSRAMYRLKKLEVIKQVGEEKLEGCGGRTVPTYMAVYRPEPDINTNSIEMEIAEMMNKDQILDDIERLGCFCVVPDGKERAARLRALAAKIESVSASVSADLMESATILEELAP